MYGDEAFVDNNPGTPDTTPGNHPADSAEYDYWDHVEYIIDEANLHGLYINFLPIFGVKEGEGYNFLTPENAYRYGLFIGKRFKNKTNIIWCMGGDVLADNDLKKSVWNLLAKGVTEGVAGSEDYSKTFMTYHVRGGHSSSEYFRDAPWLDFHMLQTWSAYTSIYSAVSADYALEPIKPVLHGEGAYEDGPEYPTKPITPHVIRKQAYWAFFAGGLHTYGNSNVWNFGTSPYYVSQDWKAALHAPGAEDLSVARSILEAVDWWKYVPDQSAIVNGEGSGDSLNAAMLSYMGDRILVYFSHPTSITVDVTKIYTPESTRAAWIDPQSGKWHKLGALPNIPSQQFTTPADWEDAILLIEGHN